MKVWRWRIFAYRRPNIHPHFVLSKKFFEASFGAKFHSLFSVTFYFRWTFTIECYGFVRFKIFICVCFISCVKLFVFPPIMYQADHSKIFPFNNPIIKLLELHVPCTWCMRMWYIIYYVNLKITCYFCRFVARTRYIRCTCTCS